MPVPTSRRHSEVYRREVVAESRRPDVSVSEVARRHDLNTNLVFRWRQPYRAEQPTGDDALIPIHVSSPAPDVADRGSDGRSDPGRIELALANGHRLTLIGDVDAELAQAVLGVLR